MNVLCQRITAPSAVDLSSVLTTLGWQAEFRQLDRGAEPVEAVALQGCTVGVMQIAFNNRVHQLAVAPEGCVTFGIPTGPQAPGRIGRRPLPSESLTCFHPVGGLDAVSQSGFSAYTIAIETTLLMDTVALFDRCGQTGLEAMLGVLVTPPPGQLAQLRSTIRSTMSIITDATISTMAKTAVWEELQADLPLLLLKAWGSGEQSFYIHSSSRARALKRALEYIHATEGQVISISQLCQQACCSLSTLERAFREHFGVSPKQYLTAVRMCSVRNTLLDGAETRPIIDIAADQGFWHMSKFAADYRRLFGELPSQTRRF
ncbi:helix-turn-helix domain-containing protein [Candidatus Litorirhabdus singularis]|uniref:helix-turn-helix domain-containing protein n=1 Tax=Candidatus Litorirhabdus singularis TaxID=2518993 RepID=UPI00242ADA7E|nr:helix-turn-helix domain-containing protein [Candidatus Litorirhabdus singularis]